MKAHVEIDKEAIETAIDLHLCEKFQLVEKLDFLTRLEMYLFYVYSKRLFEDSEDSAGSETRETLRDIIIDSDSCNKFERFLAVMEEFGVFLEEKGVV